MQESLQKQPYVKILPAFRVNEGFELRDADNEETWKLVNNEQFHYGILDLWLNKRKIIGLLSEKMI